MVLVDHATEPSRSMQRWFGASLAGLLALASWAARGMFGAMWMVGGGLAVALAAVYYLYPRSQRPIIRAWQIATFPLAWCISHLLLGAVFFLIVAPIGWILRYRGHDPLQLNGEPPPHWHDRSPAPPQRYFRQS